MKTLDEVIDAERHCISGGCIGCPYDIYEDGCQCDEDALHYLMEYRTRHDEILKTEEALGYCEIAENRPLTWDELKQMERKPVWVEYNLHLSDKDARSRMWIIVQKIMPWRKDDKLIYYSGFVFSKKEIGKTWQAYRKERTNENA